VQADCGQIAPLKDEISMNGAFARKLFGSANDRRIKSCRPRVDAIRAREAEVAALSDDTLRARTTKFKHQLEAAKSLDDVSLDDVAAKSPLSRTTIQ
jgi:preprotein translocase subunit SecA